MAILTIPITVEQLRELARQLSPEERQSLLESLLAERYEATLWEADRRRGAQAPLTDEEIQGEIDAVRSQRREGRRHAPGG